MFCSLTDSTVIHYEDNINKWVDCTESFSFKTYGVSLSTHCGADVTRKAPQTAQQEIDFLLRSHENQLCLCFDFTTAGSHILISPLSGQIKSVPSLSHKCLLECNDPHFLIGHRTHACYPD